MTGIIYIINNLIQIIQAVFFLEQTGKPKYRYIVTCSLWISGLIVIYIFTVLFNLSDTVQNNIRTAYTLLVMIALYRGKIINRFLMFLLIIGISTVVEIIGLSIGSAIYGLSFSELTVNVNHYFVFIMLMISDMLFIAFLTLALIWKRKDLLVHGNFTQIGIMLASVVIHFVAIIIYYTDKSVLDNIHNQIIQPFFQLLLYVILVFNYFNALRTRKLMESEQALKNLETEMEHNYSYYTLADEKFTEISKLRHDIHNQIQAVQHLLKTGKNKKEADEIMNHIEEQLAAAKTVHFCQNPIINSVLTVKMNTVKANGIETDILLNDCENLPFDNYDICSLFANLYDNAVEACQKIEENKERRITMRSSIKNDYFVLKIVNTCIEMPEIKSGKIKSDKNSDEHGYGTKIIDSITKKYNGTFTLRFKDNLMTAIAALKIE